MHGLRTLLSGLLLLSTSFATAQSDTTGAPAPGSTVSLLFLNTTKVALTGYVQRYDATGQTTYLINCAQSAGNNCPIHDATLSIVQGQTYDFHTAVNDGGALTIHCTFAADGTTPDMCTRTVAGGPSGYEVMTSAPTSSEFAYLPVLITKKPERTKFDGYSASVAAASQTAAASFTDVMSDTASATALPSGSSTTSTGSSASRVTPVQAAATVQDTFNAGEQLKSHTSVTVGAAVALLLTQLFFLSA